MKVMNVAVVGAGIYGINHVNAYTWNPNTNLVAVCDLNKEITDRIAEQYNVKTYNDVNEMLDNEEIDAVSIATPDAFHMDPALAAIRHGKPILVEKPLATTSEDAKKILAEAEKYNVRVAVDYHKRWDTSDILLRVIRSSFAFLIVSCCFGSLFFSSFLRFLRLRSMDCSIIFTVFRRSYTLIGVERPTIPSTSPLLHLSCDATRSISNDSGKYSRSCVYIISFIR